MKITNKCDPIAKAVRSALLAGVTASLLAIPSVYAAEEEAEAEEEEKANTIVVTGSRLQRATYSSIAPLQVITAETSKEAGMISTADIIQGASASAGQQIDLTFSNFVLDNGPGSTTADLRGLGSARTLVLLNGRRLAPAGVEGAPSAPDLNLIPGALVQQYDLLLDGASSIYGSDAVAGVANIKLRQDFDGLELNLFADIPDQPNGEKTTFSAVWGQNYDRGFIGFGAEYVKEESVALADREWTENCNRHVEIDENGQIRHLDLFAKEVRKQKISPYGCRIGNLSGYIANVPGANSIFYTPNFSNGGWGNYSDWSQFSVIPDSDRDGVADISFIDYNLNGDEYAQQGHLFPEQERISIMAYGEYTFDGSANLTPFFEAQYNKKEFFVNQGILQLFPTVPANNAFNICNPNGANGVDCGLAYDQLLTNPAYVEDFIALYGASPADYGLLLGAIGPAATLPVVAVRGDRSQTNTEIEQARVVLGLKGDLPFINFGEVTDWQFETYYSFTESKGISSREGIRDDRLNQAFDTIEDPNNPGSYICRDTSGGCVPVNMFAPSLYSSLVGDFATQAERDFLFDSRDFDTVYKQSIFAAFANGFIMNLPAGDVTAGIGLEYRIDDIESIPDDVARDGLFFGFFSDGGATGDKATKEAYAEVEIPILAGMPGAQELVLNLSTRYTKDEFYGGNNTYAAKLGYRPVESLLIRGTYGTSYRAPNVRENFLNPQTGFRNIFDPCIVPEDARDPITGDYVPANDQRAPEIITNCANNGVDATTLFLANPTYSVEVAGQGVTGLEEEESTSLSYGFAWEQPFSNEFDLTVGATYYQIEVDNTIIRPIAPFIVNDCYTRSTLDSVFCDRITRGDDGLLTIVDEAYINRDNETVRGVDVNINFAKSIDMFDYPVRWTVDLTATHMKERSEIFTDANGNRTADTDQGEFGYPDWKGRLQIGAKVGDWRATWQTYYVGSVGEDPDDVDEFSDISGTSSTCLGGANDVLCRDFGEADKYMTHTASLYYYGDSWTVGAGVRNIFNEEPPVVDGNSILAVNNAPIGAGYDLQGRAYFLNLSKTFK
ncbi:TonB-dependent receptor domain-containing protein [Aliikangiella maris]|uniref:TonB-dependent receptor n=2 Tax=Aliikangiella maris TaxID=3162458 RepID=A0ABV2BRX2_9GAMM